MKTCKKILAMMLTLAMVISMCAFTVTVSAEETATTVEPLLLTGTTFDSLADGKVMTSGSFTSEEGETKKTFYARSSSKGTITAKHEGDRKFIVTDRTSCGYNYDMKPSDAASKYGFGTTYDTFHVTYDVNVPDVSAVERYFSLQFGCVKEANLSSASGGVAYTMSVVAVNGKFKVDNATADSQGKCTVYVNESYDVKECSWQNVDIYAHLNKDNKIDICITVDDYVIYYAKGTTTAYGMGSYRNNFTSQVGTYTSYDNVMFYHEADGENILKSVMNKAYDLKIQYEAEKNETLSAQPYSEILKYSGANLVANAGAKSGSEVFKSTGVLKHAIAQSSATDVHEATAYAVVDNEYTNLTSSSYKYLIGNIRESFDNYVKKGDGETSTFVYSADMKLTDLNARIEGKFSFGLDMDTTDTIDYKNYAVVSRNIKSSLNNFFVINTKGQLGFTSEVAKSADFPAAEVEGAKIEEIPVIKAGDWFNVKLVFEITHGADAYLIKTYGIYNDVLYYVNENTITYTDYDKDGISDDIHIGQFDFSIGNDGKTHTETVTSFKSMSFVRDDNFDWSEIKSFESRQVMISRDKDGNADFIAKPENVASGVLVMAIYDANGKMVEFIPAAMTDAGFVGEIPAEKLSAGQTVKGYIFDSIASTKPLLKSGQLKIN